jgi:membrane protease YdiL (CAAX protease family)
MFPFGIVKLFSVPLDFVVIFGFLAAIVPWRGSVRIKRIMGASELAGTERLSLYTSTIAYQWSLSAIIFWRSLARGLSPLELGLRLTSPASTVLVAVGLTALLCTNQWAALRTFAKLPPEKRSFVLRFTERIMPRDGREAYLFATLACTAGISEEFIYRGFVHAALVDRFGDAPSAIAAGAVVSAMLFALAHVYQGSRGIITTFIVGLIFSLARIWTGNLLPPMIAHAGIDLLAGLYARRVFLPRGKA